ncbi:hypothetical protein PFLUV_G00127600 [Perca fluviatilis]|uniref:NIPSNAP domain-containing protein n=1 Tax=Perca fluviatilis TaxID=8168 RepID=A0A6A5FAS1_PERFL|nr:hypothetical protein PFLUV_G00127600 [Perca fluviatilis]
MVKFRIPSLRSAAALLSAPGPAAQCTVSRDNKVVLNERESPVRLSTGPQQKHTTFYEFRTYSIKPHLVPSFLQLTNQKIHLRTAHSQLIGYWSVEYGGLNQVFHIWKYDSYSERAAVRAALSQDPSWVSDYISKAMPMLSSQENEVTYLVPWSRLQTPPQTGVRNKRDHLGLGSSCFKCFSPWSNFLSPWVSAAGTLWANRAQALAQL